MPRRTIGFQLFGKRFEIEYVGNRRDAFDAEPADIPSEAPTRPSPRWSVPADRPSATNVAETNVATPTPLPPAPVAAPAPSVAPVDPTTLVSLDARRAKLARAIEAEVARGWMITALSDTSAGLTRRGQANGCIGLVLLLFAIVPGVLYALLARPMHSLFLTVDEFGQGHRTVSPGGDTYESPWLAMVVVGGLVLLFLFMVFSSRWP